MLRFGRITYGQITDVKKRVGEIAQGILTDVVITLLPIVPFEIETDIYEEDVVKIAAGNSVDISLVPFAGRTFKGRVVLINPAEKLIEGVVYYKVTVVFEETPKELRPGMTADLVIKTALKENVLVIPEDALSRKDGKTVVQVLFNDIVEEREVQIGMQGTNDMLEIISGLEEGEKVILLQ